MNLALITQDFPPELGGIQTYAVELANRFAKNCDNFFVIAPDKPEAQKVDQQLPYPVHRIRTSNPLLGVKAMFQSPELFAKYEINNVFHAQWQTLPTSLYAQRKGLIDNIFVAVHARELVFNPFNTIPVVNGLYERYKRKMLSQVDFFFPVSDFMGELLHQHGIEKERMKVIINGTNPERFKPTDTPSARESIGVHTKKVLLSVSRLVSKKGIDTTIKAFAKVLKRHPNSCYVIVGDGKQERKLKQMTADLGIEDSVKFVGSVYHDDPKLIDYYNACDVFVMPSKTEKENIEGCPIVYLEANACKKPVIGTFSSGIPSAVKNGKTGILVEERNPDALAEAIDKLFGDPDLASEMGQKGRERVEKEANWDACAASIFHQIEDKV